MKMRNMSKNALTIAVGAGLVVAPVLSAQAYEFAISGQINRMAVQLDNGDQDSLFFLDSDSSSSRIRFVGSGDLGAGKAGMTIEHQFESNTSAALDFPAVSSGSDQDSIRKVEGWFSGDWGKITIGQGSDATDGVTEVDLGGTVWTGGVYAYPVDMMGGVTWVTSNGRPAANPPGKTKPTTVAGAITTFDGGRRDRVRYDSPTLGGALSFAVSLADGERLDANIGGTHEFGQSTFAWRVGISDQGDIGSTVGGGAVALEPDNVEPSVTVGSAALKIGNWDFTYSFSEKDFDETGRTDAEEAYIRLGYVMESGHSYAIGTGTFDDFKRNNDEAEVFQFGWGYSPNSSVDLYASWTEAEFDPGAGALPPGVSVEDVTAILFGTRVKFK